MNDPATATVGRPLDQALARLREMMNTPIRVAFIDDGCPPGEARAVVYGELTDHPQEGPDGSTTFGLKDGDSGENVGRLVFFADEPVVSVVENRPGYLWLAFAGGAGVEVSLF